MNQDRQSEDYQNQSNQKEIDLNKDYSSSNDEQQSSDLEIIKKHGRNDINVDSMKRAKKINSKCFPYSELLYISNLNNIIFNFD